MRQLNIHDVGDVRLDSYQRPDAGPGDVVVRMKACGICGSDLSYIKNGGIPGPGRLTPLGHEGAGEVLFVGDAVAGLRVGQPVIINPMNTPSFIGSGGPEGAFTEELLVRGAALDDNLLPIPDGIPYDVAAMCEPLAVALHGVNRAEAKAGTKLVIFGCGPIGLGMVLWAVDRGCDVIAVDLADERLARAAELGARTINPGREDLIARVKELHGAEMYFRRERASTDAYIDAAGAPSILGDVIQLAKFQARHVITAAYMKPIELNAGAMLTSELTITTAVGYPTEFPDVIAAMPRLRDKIAALISHRLPFDRVIEGLGVAAQPASAKVMIEFDGAAAMSDAKDQPQLASLVTAGDGQTAAVAITDSIFMAKDISNAYLLTTADGDLLVNAGFIGNGARTKALFAPHRTGPLRRVIFTQSHADHYGGLPEQLEEGTQVIAGAGFTETAAYFDRLEQFLGRRSGKLWASLTRRNGPPPKPPKVVPDIEVADVLAFEQGGRRFEVHKTPGGETLCSVFVWLPDERTVFTGNLFGPVWRAMPNLVTMRGDRPRLVRAYLQSLETVRALGAELVVTGHGEPIRGAERIRADLDAMEGAVRHIEERTIAGMNAGRSVRELMREITLPEHLTIGEFHGKTSWVVRAIWEENGGWFHFDEGTTGLYGVPRSAVDAEVAALAGVDALVAHAQVHVDGGRPLEALHLTDIALAAEPDHPQARAAKKAALEALLAASGGTNLSETMWLKSELAALAPPA